MARSYVITSGPPLSIYPYAKQGEVTIRNTGSVDIYAATQPVAANGVAIAPGSSLAWPELTALYLYVLSGVGNASIFDGTLSAPTSVGIDGPVAVSTIGTPVNVQGGATVLYSGDVIVPATGSEQIIIPLPANGLTYYGFRLQITPLAGTGKFSYSLNGQVGIPLAEGSSNDIDGLKFVLDAGTVNPYMVDASGPLAGTFPLALNLNNYVGAPQTFRVLLIGTSYAPPVIAGNLDQICAVTSIVTASGTAFDFMLPPSHTPYCANVMLNTAVTSASVLMQKYGRDNGFYQIDYRAFPTMVGLGMTAYQRYTYVTHGTGYAERLRISGLSSAAVAYASLSPLN